MGILVEKFWLFSNATHTFSVLHRTNDVIPIALLLQLSELGVEEKEEDKQEESVSIVICFFPIILFHVLNKIINFRKVLVFITFSWFWENRILFS